MTLTVQINDAEFQNFVASNVPQQTGLRGFYYLGGTATKSTRNLAPSGAASVIVGAPTFGAYSMTGSAGNRVNSTLSPTAAFTFLTLVKKPANSVDVGLISNYFGPSTNDMLSITGGFVRCFAADGAGNSTANAGIDGALTVGNWHVMFGRAGASLVEAGFVASGVLTKGSAAIASRTTTTQPISIGAAEAYFTGANEQAVAAIWDRVLSDADIVEVYNFLKTAVGASITVQ